MKKVHLFEANFLFNNKGIVMLKLLEQIYFSLICDMFFQRNYICTSIRTIDIRTQDQLFLFQTNSVCDWKVFQCPKTVYSSRVKTFSTSQQFLSYQSCFKCFNTYFKILIRWNSIPEYHKPRPVEAPEARISHGKTWSLQWWSVSKPTRQLFNCIGEYISV